MSEKYTPIAIIPLKFEHLDEVMDIEPVAFGSHHWSKQSFINELSNSMGHYFAAVNQETKKLIGYTGFWLIGEEAHITTLAVHPDFRRQHIGELLLIHDIIQGRLVGAHWVTLEVRASNEPAQFLYYKYGFKSLGVRRHYYQDNDEDALVLWAEKISSAEFTKMIQQRLSVILLTQDCQGVAQGEFSLDEDGLTRGSSQAENVVVRKRRLRGASS